MVETIANFPVDVELKHSLPIPQLTSRLSTSVILSFLGRSKPVIMFALTLNRKSRAFIITQGCIPGFLQPNHDNIDSLLFELQTSESFRKEVNCDLSSDRIEEMAGVLKSVEKFDSESIVSPSTCMSILRDLLESNKLTKLIKTLP